MKKLLFVLLAFLIAAAYTACGESSPTEPGTVIQTPTPGAQPTQTPGVAATPTPTQTPGVAATPTPDVDATPTPTRY